MCGNEITPRVLAIRRYDDQAFDDMIDESGKKTTIVKKNHCGLFQVEALVRRPKKW